MSSNTPGPTDGPPNEPAGSSPDVEYLGDQPAPAKRSGRRTGLVAAATIGVVAAAGAGAWAVAAFMSGGPAPAGAVPADALVYFALDLDPDGGQKIEAVQTLRKFPAIREELGIDASDDLRRVLFDAITAEAPCPELDYADEVEPWLGGKLAVSAVPGDDEPVMFFAVQVEDEELATAAVETIAECAGEDVPGTAFVGDFMVVAETEEIADDIAADAGESSLADDDEFGRWIDEAGGSGIIEAYVSAEAPSYFADDLELPSAEDLEGMGDTGGLIDDSSAPPIPDAEELFADFEGAAMVVRFDDEALEVEMAAGLPSQVQTGGDSGMGDLPATTALALGFGVHETAVQDGIDSFAELTGMEQSEIDEMFAQAEEDTGLTLPEDLQTLLGDGLSVAVDSSLDLEGMVNGGSAPVPTEVPAGLRIVGDQDEITEVLDKVRTALRPMGGALVVEEGDGVVALGFDPDYVETLAEDGTLGDEERFEAALGDLEESTVGVYVDFDADDWLTELAALDPDERIEENVAPLDSLGITGGFEDDVSHVVMRLTTD